MTGFYHIPLGLPFIDQLAQHLLDHYDDHTRAQTWVLLPTGRSCRALKESLVAKKGLMLLPRIKVLSELSQLLPQEKNIISPPQQAGVLSHLLQKAFSLHLPTALALAEDLLKLLEEVDIAEADINQLLMADVPVGSAYWEKAASFLKIVIAHWPEILGERQQVTPAQYNRWLLDQWCEMWQETPPQHPVILAGSTGSRPATRRIMHVIAQLPEGKVILPGIQPHLPSVSLLKDSGLTGFLDQMTAPVIETQPHPWPNVTLIETQNLIHEARTVALLAHERHRETGKSVLIVAPDPKLIKLLRVEFLRWGIHPQISLGIPWRETPEGVRVQHIAELMASRDTLVALNILRDGDTEMAQWEKNLRAHRPHDMPDRAKALWAMLPDNGEGTLQEFLKIHQDICTWMGLEIKEWDALYAAAESFPPLLRVEYPYVFAQLVKDINVVAFEKSPIEILGRLEARLIQAHTTILTGLNEGSWPAKWGEDPWLTVGQRNLLGLPTPEHRIALATHDFCMSLSASEVFLTRSAQVGGTPTVPSRWIERLRLMAQMNKVVIPSGHWADRSQMLDQGGRGTALKRPAPCPASEGRPRKVSVSALQRLLKDPYVYYLAHVLRLRPQNPLGKPLSQQDWGILLHQVLDQHVQTQEPLITIATKAMGKLNLTGMQTQYWRHRMEFLTQWIENQWIQRPFQEVMSERSGEMSLAGYTVTAIADRIEKDWDAQTHIIDFKTGAIPSKKDLESGLAPQLPLEGMIFASDIATISLEFWLCRYPSPEVIVLKDPETLVNQAQSVACEALSRYSQDPFEASLEAHFSDFEPLIRRQEWIAHA